MCLSKLGEFSLMRYQDVRLISDVKMSQGLGAFFFLKRAMLKGLTPQTVVLMFAYLYVKFCFVFVYGLSCLEMCTCF